MDNKDYKAMYYYTKGKLENSNKILEVSVKIFESSCITLRESGESYSESRKALENSLLEAGKSTRSLEESIAATGEAFDKTARSLEESLVLTAEAFKEINAFLKKSHEFSVALSDEAEAEE
jgi:hypothetical protein